MIDLPAYLARIGLPAAPVPDAAGLAMVQRAHRLSIPFDSLDVGMRRDIPLAPDAVFDKLVRRRRGGYCFEHNVLFIGALHALGFAARALLARVWLGAEEVQPLVHTFALVTFSDGSEWIADAGFGAAYAPPLPLIDGAEADTTDGARHRLSRDPQHGWMLRRIGNGAATDGRGDGHASARAGLAQYSFTTAPVWPADLALGNHWSATAPDSRFVRHRVVSIVLPSGFASLTDRRYARASGGERVTAEIMSAKAYRLRLAMVFGIDLDPAEIDALGLF